MSTAAHYCKVRFETAPDYLRLDWARRNVCMDHQEQSPPKAERACFGFTSLHLSSPSSPHAAPPANIVVSLCTLLSFIAIVPPKRPARHLCQSHTLFLILFTILFSRCVSYQSSGLQLSSLRPSSPRPSPTAIPSIPPVPRILHLA